MVGDGVGGVEDGLVVDVGVAGMYVAKRQDTLQSRQRSKSHIHVSARSARLVSISSMTMSDSLPSSNHTLSIVGHLAALHGSPICTSRKHRFESPAALSVPLISSFSHNHTYLFSQALQNNP